MFKKITVKEVKQETNDTVSVSFDIPEALKNEFQYQAGQYITIKHLVNGEDVRRAYSLSSAPNESDYRIAVKKIENGKMSSFLNENLKTGDSLDVMSPAGNFKILNSKGNNVGFAAGSGITPIISMIKATLNAGGNFTLFYSNKTASEVIFKTELESLRNNYPSNLKIHYLYSRETLGNQLLEGRINKIKCDDLMNNELEHLKADAFYMCGPEEMVANISESLLGFDVSKEKIHFELFTAPTNEMKEEAPKSDSNFSGESQVHVIMDGEDFEFALNSDGDFILDAAMNEGADVPFSCKGAVCCTCKAQVIEGKAIMDMNYALSDEEVEEGFILTCQARPASKKLVVDYDVI